MKTLFGTDGIRGVAGQFPLDAATVMTVGFSLARHLTHALGRPPVIVLGRDTRESGPWLERAIIDGATISGAQCHSAGVITTPGVAFLTSALRADAGIVISASHNPYHDNGLKIFAPSGRKLDDSTERAIESDILVSNGRLPGAVSDLPVTPDDSLQQLYLDFLVKVIGEGLSLRGLKLVVDCANGAASTLAPALFKQLEATVVTMNSQPDGKNINRDSGSLHLEGLCQRVMLEGAALGLAVDGDADRVLFVDHNANPVDGDATLWVLANYFNSRNELKDQVVVATVMSNVGLEIALRSRGIRLVRTDVGDKNVLEELVRLNASLGGEQSGHIIIPRLSLAGDGLITALSVLRALRDAGEPLEELIRGFQRYPQILLNVSVREKRPFTEIPQVQRLAAEIERSLGNSGRLLLRYSGTEPLARIMIEGENQGEIESHARELAAVIEQVLGDPPAS